jgi:hypothetical protein
MSNTDDDSVVECISVKGVIIDLRDVSLRAPARFDSP